MLLSGNTYTSGGPDTNRADALKVVYTYHFLRLIKWPAEPKARLNVCILGNSRFGDLLLTELPKKSVRGKQILTRQLLADSTEFADCQILYIPDSYAIEIDTMIARIRTMETLSLSDFPGFVQRGGVLGFVVDGDKVHFDINLQEVRRKAVKVSADLLEVARYIVDGES